MITERIDAITEIPPERLKPVLPAPKSVKIEISPRCNYRCGFCALRTRETQPKEDMDFELFKRITMEMKEAGVEEIGVFYLGESFMNVPLLVDCIRYLKDEIEMPYVFLTSNGSLARPADVQKVMEAGLDSLKWSVNAAEPGQFVEIMGVKATLMEQALENIRRAYHIREAFGYRTRLYASSILFEGEQRERMERLLKERVIPYVDQHYFLPLYGMSMRSKEVEEAIGYTPTHGNMGRIGALRKPIPCWSAFQEGHVRADGGLSVCCFGADDRFDVGNLKDRSFMELWNNEKFQAIREAHIRADTEGLSALNGTMCEVCVV